jgi:hypothetical protein
MPKPITGLVAAAMLTAVFAMPSQARAEVQYPWCAEYGGRSGGATNCGFVTHAQCMATVHGIGGYCYENPAYRGARQKKQATPR